MSKKDKIISLVVCVVYASTFFFLPMCKTKNSVMLLYLTTTMLFLAYGISVIYKYFKIMNTAAKTRLSIYGATMSGILRHVSGLPIANGLLVEMYYGPEKIIFKHGGDKIVLSIDKITNIDIINTRSRAAAGRYVFRRKRRAAVGTFSSINMYLVISYVSNSQNKNIKLYIGSSAIFAFKVEKDFRKTHSPKHNTIEL